MKRKRVLFIGEKPLGLKCLRFLHELPETEVIAVCTRTKGDFWWGKQEIIAYCEKKDIPIIPRAKILTLDVDFMISVLYPFILEPHYINHIRNGCFNLHEAPLPRWRGCNNYSHAILAGDRTYGTTIHEMTPELDAGHIVAERMFQVPAWVTAKELYELTSHESYQLAKEWFPRILSGNYRTYPPSCGEESFLNQRDSLARLKEIPFDTPLQQVLTTSAALDFVPWEPAYVTTNGYKFYLFFESSIGREKARFSTLKELSLVNNLAAIPWGTFEVGRMGALPRSLMICRDDVYRQQFPLRV